MSTKPQPPNRTTTPAPDALREALVALDWRDPLAAWQVQALAAQLLAGAFGYTSAVDWVVNEGHDGSSPVHLTATIPLVSHDMIPIALWVSVVYTAPTRGVEPNDPLDAAVRVEVRDTRVAQVWYRFDVERRHWIAVHHDVVAN